MWTDVETRSKTAVGTAPGPGGYQIFCFHMLPSIPDMATMVVSDDFMFKDCQGNAVTRRHWKPHAHPWERNRADYSMVTIHLLEVKYTYDLRVHDMVEPALQQHEDLANILRTAGKWGAVRVHPFIIGGAGIMRKDNDRILETLGLGEAAIQSLLKELSIHSILRTSRILEICRPYLTSPAELEGTGGATGGTDGTDDGSGGGPATDAGGRSNAPALSAGQGGSGARPAPKRHREPDDGAPARPATLVLSSTGRRIRLTLAAQAQLHDEMDEKQEDSCTAEETPWTLANVSARRAMRGSTHRDAGRAQSGRPKRSAGRPARLADGAEFSSGDELGVPLLTGAAVSVPPPTATAKRAMLHHEAFPSTDAGDAHAGPSEETAAQHEGAARERAPRRSGRHRTPSRRLADAVADAAGRQHGALIAPKRAADGQPPSADEGRPKKSRRLTAQLHPSIPEGSTPATLLPVHYIPSDGGGPHLDPSMHGKRPRITPAKVVNTTFVPITGTQAAPSHVAAAARTVCRSRRRQSRRKTSAAPAPAPGQPAAPSPIDRPRATPL